VVSPAWLLAVAVLTAPQAPTPAPTPAPAPPSASGTFEDKRYKVPIHGAYAFRDKAWMDDGTAIRVAVSNDEMPSDALDEHYDRTHAINTLFADDETKVVYFELDEKGGYHGYSYYFESGDGCGYCFDSTVKSTVRAVDGGGRLRGELSFTGDDVRFQIQLDLPIPPKSWGDPLPRDGGEPGKAFLAYHDALVKRDAKAVRPLVSNDNGQWLDAAAKKGKVAAELDSMAKDHPTKSVRVVQGWSKGNRAVLIVAGETSSIRLAGDAVLVNEGGRWRVDDELYDVVLQ